MYTHMYKQTQCDHFFGWW